MLSFATPKGPPTQPIKWLDRRPLNVFQKIEDHVISFFATTQNNMIVAKNFGLTSLIANILPDINTLFFWQVHAIARFDVECCVEIW